MQGVRICFPAKIAQIFTNEKCYVDMLKILATDDHTGYWCLTKRNCLKSTKIPQSCELRFNESIRII
jgi:hypothetical protein